VEPLPTVCLTNDDGPSSIGLLRLAEALTPRVDLTVVVPNQQRSGASKALTLGRPLRIASDVNTGSYRMIVHDGFPADSVIIALSLVRKIDLFVSGINSGANVGYHRMLTSGTVGAIFEAALQGYPGIALSYSADPVHWFTEKGVSEGIEHVCHTSARLIDHVLEHGLPSGVDGLNVNFPAAYSGQSGLVVVEPSNAVVRNKLEKRLDPYDKPYYWIRGGEKFSNESHDAKEVSRNGNITVSPIVIRSVITEHTERTRLFLKDLF